ncbi:hypothetical protein B0H16DRAFT_1619626 [Mycena metata]|uniref:Protein kinase domain-containing protein n=1 Tax=Mycena metata TaxID=1033252 RepID=A0AAD7H705_9AGAR|nr:hypothetical protein B0H16DRAFT_1619626 [Mycena metata]
MEDTESLETLLVARSKSSNWLAQTIQAVRMIAAGADFIPLPYITAALGAVVVLLQMVDNIKKNRDDLRDLCASTVEIVLILRNEVWVNGKTTAPRFYCLSYYRLSKWLISQRLVSLLSVVRTGLEKLIESRRGIRGRLKEFVGATSIADQIQHYKTRVNDLRSNFLLLATLKTHRQVSSIYTNMGPVHRFRTHFRHVAFGDINLLYETSTPSKAYKIKVFAARVWGEASLMTVVKYEDGDENWKQDLELYSRFRHPNIWQLFGVSTAPELLALVYHDGAYTALSQPTL